MTEADNFLSPKHHGGFTLIEVLIALGLTSLLFMLMISFVSVSTLKNHSRLTVEATAIAATELEGLRAISFNTVANRASTSFFTQLYTLGTWSVQSGSSNELRGISTGLTGTTGEMKVPANGHSDYSTQVKVTVAASSPAGWGAGLIVRARETDRLYRYYAKANQLILDKVEPTGTTTLQTIAAVVSTGTPITLGVSMNGSIFTLTANGLTVGTFTDANPTWSGGDTGLVLLNGATATFDDAQIDSALVTDGDFQSSTVGSLPSSWNFLQPTSLPGGTGSITIADYNGDDTIKEATATLTWREEQRTRSLTLKSLLSQ